MAFLILLMMLTACAAIPRDLTGKMFTFPEETNTAHVRLTTSRQVLDNVTVCLRFFTDLQRNYALFSLATPTAFNDFLIFNLPNNKIGLWIRDKEVQFGGQNYMMNTWHSICSTWDSESGLGQLWLDGKPSSRKFFRSGSKINGPILMVLGQEQDAYGGGFDSTQSFVGMLADVHMWDYVLSPYEIHNYAHNSVSVYGNLLDWKKLDFQVTGRVVIENKQ